MFRCFKSSHSILAQGWGPFVGPAFGAVADVIGQDTMYNALEQADEEANPGLVYFNHQYKGFFAVKATKEEHIAEFFVIDPQVILSNYTAARTSSGGIVAEFMCDTQVTTKADVPGSLERSEQCGAIQFETERSPIDTIPFPQASLDDVSTDLSDCGYAQCEFDVASSETSTAPQSIGLLSAAILMTVVCLATL